MIRKPWVATLLLAGALSVLVAPALVLLIGTSTRGAVGDLHFSLWEQVEILFILGVSQFGLFFLLAGLIAGWLSTLGARHGLALRVTAIVTTTVLFPVAAVLAIGWSNRGRVPLIQDTTPYFIGGFPAGFVIGVLTLLFATRVARNRPVTGGSS